MTPCRERERFTCRMGFGRSLARASSENQPRSSSNRCNVIRRSPSITVRTSRGAPPSHEVVHLVVGLDRLARVAPETVEDVRLHLAPLDKPVVHVRDLELAARGRF